MFEEACLLWIDEKSEKRSVDTDKNLSGGGCSSFINGVDNENRRESGDG